MPLWPGSSLSNRIRADDIHPEHVEVAEVMQHDWKVEIARVIYWKQLIAERDQEFPWHLPQVAAKNDRIEAAQHASGIEFSSQYRDFLSHADGWLGFYMWADLFGTTEFISGLSRNVSQRPRLLELLRGCGLDPREVAPIGASDSIDDVFVLVSAKSRTLPGGVVWFVETEIDRYESFVEFFGSMVNYNARLAEQLKGGQVR
jgi:hypothetical protein